MDISKRYVMGRALARQARLRRSATPGWCPGCGKTWEAVGRTEYGVWLPERDDDLLYEECGAEGEA